MITFDNVTLRRGANVLLDQIQWTLYQGEHIGLIGANGSGKSSLFSMIQGELAPDTGSLLIPSSLQIAHVAQEIPVGTQSALDYVLDADKTLRTLEAELRVAEEKEDGLRISELHDALHQIDAYRATARAAELLDGLGFHHTAHHHAVNSFSGGFRIRLNLAQALMCRSDLLLLDEPTNHLDLDAIIWLENWIKQYQGTLILISHDREFLDHTVTRIAHIKQQKVTLYTGDYSFFEKQRAEAELQQKARYAKEQRQVAHMQDFIDRFKAKASKAKQAQSRVKALGRMTLTAMVHQSSPFQFSFSAIQATGSPLIAVDRVSFSYGDKLVLENINLHLAPRDRIAFIGPNGAGKSTFIKLLAGALEPTHGSVNKHQHAKIGYFDQHQVEALVLNESAFYHLKQLNPRETESNLRKFLGQFNFKNDQVFVPLSQFSGGEKSRLALALLVYQKPNVLLLDEPTNHLDIEMREALALALQDYDGAIILVSHDRYLIRTCVDQLTLIANHQAIDFEGDLDQYETWLKDYRKQAAKKADQKHLAAHKKDQRKETTDQRAQLKTLTDALKKIEKTIATLQNQLVTLEQALAAPDLYNDPSQKETLRTLLLEQAELKKKLDTKEQEWVDATDALENVKK